MLRLGELGREMLDREDPPREPILEPRELGREMLERDGDEPRLDPKLRLGELGREMLERDGELLRGELKLRLGVLGRDTLGERRVTEPRDDTPGEGRVIEERPDERSRLMDGREDRDGERLTVPREDGLGRVTEPRDRSGVGRFRLGRLTVDGRETLSRRLISGRVTLGPSVLEGREIDGREARAVASGRRTEDPRSEFGRVTVGRRVVSGRVMLGRFVLSGREVLASRVDGGFVVRLSGRITSGRVDRSGRDRVSGRSGVTVRRPSAVARSGTVRRVDVARERSPPVAPPRPMISTPRASSFVSVRLRARACGTLGRALDPGPRTEPRSRPAICTRASRTLASLARGVVRVVATREVGREGANSFRPWRPVASSHLPVAPCKRSARNNLRLEVARPAFGRMRPTGVAETAVVRLDSPVVEVVVPKIAMVIEYMVVVQTVHRMEPVPHVVMVSE